MAYSNSFALIAILLVATTTIGNAQVLPPISLIPTTVAVLGVIRCTLFPSLQPTRVNVTLSCDGGRTAVVPPVSTDLLGVFTISVRGAAASLIDPTRCAVFLTMPVSSCPAIGTGQVLRAPITVVSQILPSTFAFLRLFLAGIFSLATIT